MMKIRKLIVPGLFITALVALGLGTETLSRASVQLGDSTDIPVVEVTAVDYAFEAPGAIRSGWTTFQLHNEGQAVHLLYLRRLPKGRTFEDIQRKVEPAYKEVARAVNDQNLVPSEANEKLRKRLPSWASGRIPAGGVGLVSPGETAQATTFLAPGHYQLTCFVKGANGNHAALGMNQSLLVRQEPTGASSPTDDVEITVTPNEMQIDGTPRRGRTTVAVRFEDGSRALHLARLNAQTDPEALAGWIDGVFYTNGFLAPSSAEYVGGTMHRAEGQTAYFTADLTPGRYAWVTQPAGIIRTFTIE